MRSFRDGPGTDGAAGIAAAVRAHEQHRLGACGETERRQPRALCHIAGEQTCHVFASQGRFDEPRFVTETTADEHPGRLTRHGMSPDTTDEVQRCVRRLRQPGIADGIASPRARHLDGDDDARHLRRPPRRHAGRFPIERARTG